ncbi:MAG: hypothetical protein DMG13_21330 [Acidobacteria bacterium]|nr:MAG: hypothetical protein DMG13_21330 [Acidobacteriota bacterium]
MTSLNKLLLAREAGTRIVWPRQLHTSRAETNYGNPLLTELHGTNGVSVLNGGSLKEFKKEWFVLSILLSSMRLRAIALALRGKHPRGPLCSKAPHTFDRYPNV